MDYATFKEASEQKSQRTDDITRAGDSVLHIAICDDEKDFVQYLTDLLNQYSKETGQDIKITPYYDGMELIEKYDPTIDLIFLDIQMKMVDGLHAAERIRQMDKTVGIIFLTTLTQYGLEGLCALPYQLYCQPVLCERSQKVGH